MAAVVEFFTGALMEKVFKCKWWDYTGYKHNLEDTYARSFRLCGESGQR